MGQSTVRMSMAPLLRSRRARSEPLGNVGCDAAFRGAGAQQLRESAASLADSAREAGPAPAPQRQDLPRSDPTSVVSSVHLSNANTRFQSSLMLATTQPRTWASPRQ